MKIAVIAVDEQIITLEANRDESIENLKALLEVETRVPRQQQLLLFHGEEMRNADTLSVLGVNDGDLVMMVSNALPSSRAPTDDLGFNPDGSAVYPSAFQQHQQDEELALVLADPYDVDAQKKIEAAIRQKGIDENMAAALAYYPEGFARGVMPYVDIEVNGVPLKALVDSGAQSTIISKSCAERCGLLRLLDTSHRSIAHGVGQSEILGRIHVAPIKIGKIFYPCSFLVLDSPNMEFLFGMDMLHKHQCVIDLKNNVLRDGGGELVVPFLHEKDIPSRLFDEERYAKEVSSSGAQLSSGGKERSDTPKGGSSSGNSQGQEFETKVAKLVEPGLFGREVVIQALKKFNGNEEQAAAYLFEG